MNILFISIPAVTIFLSSCDSDNLHPNTINIDGMITDSKCFKYIVDAPKFDNYFSAIKNISISDPEKQYIVTKLCNIEHVGDFIDQDKSAEINNIISCLNSMAIDISRSKILNIDVFNYDQSL